MRSIKPLFDAFYIWMTLGCSVMENVTKLVGNLAFFHIVWNSNVKESRKFTICQVSTEYQPAIFFYVGRQYSVQKRYI